MALESLYPLLSNQGILLLIIFILFVLAIKQVMKIVMNAIYIIVAAVLFPIIGSRVLGLSVPADANAITSFIVLGLIAYFGYLVIKSAYTIVKYGKKAAKKVIPEFKTAPKTEKPNAAQKETPAQKEKEGSVQKPRIKNDLLSRDRAKEEKKLLEEYLVIEEPQKSGVKSIKEIKFRKKRKD